MIVMMALYGCAVAPTVELTRIDGPKDVKEDKVDTFYLRESFPITMSGLIYSACRSATVKFSYKGKIMRERWR